MPPQPDISSLPFDTDIEAAVERLSRSPAPEFAMPANRFHKAKAADKANRRGIKNFIRPENAAAVIANLPEPGGRTHCLLRGDFVLCDIIPQIIAARGRCDHLRIATLGMSVANADTLACLVERGHVGKLTLLVSLYFAQVDKKTVFRAVTSRLHGIARPAVTRNHAKVICLPTSSGDAYVVEGSANLRSSDNVEQMLITNDGETHAFHAAWIDELAA